MASQPLLIELGTEELPPKTLQKLSAAFSAEIRKGLVDAGFKLGEFKDFCSPRRLAVTLEGIADKAPDRSVERKGPAIKAAFDAEGNPSKAAQGFARSCGVNIEDLGKLETDASAWLLYKSEQAGETLSQLLPEIITSALNKLPIAKRMRWGAGETEFVRPVQWLVIKHGDAVLPAEVYGITSGDVSRGHRFHHEGPVVIESAASYAEQLKAAYVMADFNERREVIRQQVEAKASSLGGQAVLEEDLLAEVTALVEWPVALAGGFEAKFLEIPQEALITTMQDNQKYFAVVDAQGQLLPHFITVSNIESKQPEVVISGNERVIRPRFADAAFFWGVDRKSALETRTESLKKIVFQQKLGTLFDKTERVAILAGSIAGQIGVDVALAKRAAQLSKCDLMTDMVGEFASMQGIAGRYYALNDGEDVQVAEALEQQYWPKQAGAALPTQGVAQAVALADKLDTLVGIFGIGMKPTGAKDPFALRRASLGILRIMVECELSLDLKAMIAAAAEGLGDKLTEADVVNDCFAYVSERMKAYYADRGMTPDVIDAVLSLQPTQPLDVDQRIHAVNAFKALPEAQSLAAANKRIRNILKKQASKVAADVSVDLLQDAAEKDLFAALGKVSAGAIARFDAGDYQTALTELAQLREPIDRFFDDVMVMADDEALKNNRLALLATMEDLFGRAADLSRLQ